jgi:O-antigen/teichoic acid export membrane protein
MLIWVRTAFARTAKVVGANLKADALFALLMTGAASLGLLKALSLAWALSPEDFGQYIAGLGLATIASILMSFGAVESTIKLYPTLYVHGHYARILTHARNTALSLGLRCVSLGGIFALLAYFVMENYRLIGFEPQIWLLIGGLGWLRACLALIASIVRAIGNPRFLQIFTLSRSAAILIVTLPCALLFGWRATLIGEAVGISLVIVKSVFTIMRLLADSSDPRVHTFDVDDNLIHTEGKRIYFSTLIASTIPYGGRSFILAASGPTMAGAFGLLTIIAQVGQMFAGAIVQKLGPTLIKDAAQGNKDVALIDRFGTAVLFIGMLSVCTLVALLASLSLPTGAAFWASYDISALVLTFAALNIMMMIYLFMQFALIALDASRALLEGAILAAVTCYCGFFITAHFDFGLIGYALSVFLADFIRSGYLVGCYLRKLRHLRLKGETK